MRKRLLKWCGALLLAGVAIALLFPQSRYGLIGLMRDERFEEGCPTSYWIHALKDPDPEVRMQAATCLARIGPGAAEAAPALVLALDDEVALMRAKAAFALFKMGARNKDALPKLIVLLKDDNPLTRLNASMALLKFGPEGSAAVTALIEAVRDQKNAIHLFPAPVNTRQQAAAALGSIGPDARAAVPCLIEALDDDDHILRGVAARSLGRIHCSEAVPALVRACRNDRYLGPQVAVSLGDIGPEARSAVPLLCELLHESSDVVRREAAKALRRIDPEAAAKAGVP